MAKKKAAKKDKKKAAPKKRDIKNNKVKTGEVTDGGNPTKLWCQFAASQDEKHRILKAKAVRGFKTLGEYAEALIKADVKGLGAKVK